MKTIGERIRAERETQKISRSELARYAGISATTLSDLELGYSKSTTALHKIAERLGVSTKWLETGKGLREVQAPHTPEYDDILAYAQGLGLGAGTEAQEYAETHALKFKVSSLQKQGLLGRKLSIYYGKGDSMEPRIKTGDAILFDETDTTPIDGAIYVVTYRGEVYAKRIEIVDDLVLVKSDNPAGDHHWKKAKRLDNPRDPIHIVGRVRWIGSWEG